MGARSGSRATLARSATIAGGARIGCGARNRYYIGTDGDDRSPDSVSQDDR
jgi:hypothetical protein